MMNIKLVTAKVTKGFRVFKQEPEPGVPLLLETVYVHKDELNKLAATQPGAPDVLYVTVSLEPPA